MHRIQFPTYTGLPVVDWHGDQGSINALVGSRIELGLAPSIPLTSAQAVVERLDTGDRETIPLSYSSERSVWSVAWDCESDVRFQFQLKARIEESEDSIENTYSPVHELNVVADHSPAAGWLTTSRTFWNEPPRAQQAWIIAPEELIPMAAWIADDLPGAVLEQQISVNRGPWKRVPVEIREFAERVESIGLLNPTAGEMIDWIPLDGVDNPTHSKWEWIWDAMSSDAISGDTVAVRVAVKDSLEQWSYSPAIEFSLASPGFERTRHNALFARASLLPELVGLAQFIHESREILEPRLQEARSGSLSSEDQARIATDITERARTWVQSCDDIRERSVAILSELPRPLDQSETEYVVRLVSRLGREYASRLLEASVSLSAASSSDPRALQRIQKSIDAATQALQQADDHGARLVEVYRQFIGHETLTALTKDMMVFRDHEAEQIQRFEKMDFSMLARSQQIAQQYIDAIQSLAQRMEPSVSTHLQNQFKEFNKFLDQTRTDLHHRCDQEPTTENFNLLANDIKRVHENLGHQHWVFHLDGGLWWNVSDTRRDLIQRSTGLHTSMLQSIESMDSIRAELADKQMESDVVQQVREMTAKMAGIRIQNATMQMLDLRDFHQHRIPADPNFSRDMGLASRAWESQCELWANESHESDEWGASRERVHQVIKAYRVLEIAHEMQDLRFTLEYLRREEQYAWRSLEGQLAHVRLWDSLSHRVELVHQWMNEAGFPQPVSQAYRALLWSEASNRIRQKMDPRRHANNEMLVSASAEIDAWMREWREAEIQAAPTIEEARRFLASLSPSIPELANRAARETKVLRESSSPDRLNSMVASDFELQNQRSQRSIERLEDALIENAMRQDILDPMQLEIAKDSDHALRWLNDLSPPMRAATEGLIQAHLQAESAAELSEASSQAVNRQSSMIDALEHVAKHFELLEDPNRKEENISEGDRLRESRSRLQPETERDRQPLESYDRADRLTEMANRAPEALLQQLEAELQRNEPMQRELSELSQDSVADATQQLKKAANDESAISKQLENSDLERRGAKEIEAQMLRHLGEATDRLAVSMLEKSAEVVKRLNLPETRKSINELSEDLKSAAREARNADPNQPEDELKDRLSKLFDQVEEAKKTLEALTPRLETKIESPSSKDDKQRQGQLTEMKSWQSLMRDDALRRVREQATRTQQLSDKAERDAEARRRDLQQRMQGRKKLIEEFRSHPDRTWVREALDRNTLETSRANAELGNAQRLAESSKRLTDAVAKRAQALESAQRANLDRPNPVAALADEQLASAAKELEAISEQLQPMSKSQDNAPNPAPSASALSQSSETQDRLTEQVEQLAQQMSRSSRHEARLQNTEGSKKLADQSHAIDQVVNNDLTTAQEQLQKATEAALQQQDSAAAQARESAVPSQESAPQNGNPEASKAMESTDAAAKALNALAQQLEQVGTPKSGNDSPGTPQERSGTPPSKQGSQSPEDMARLLDAIDQKLFGGGGQGQRTSKNGKASTQQASSESSGKEGDSQGTDADDSSRSESSSSKSAGGKSSSNDRSDGNASKESDSSGAKDEGTMREAFRDAANEIAAQLQSERMANRQNADPSKRQGKNSSSARTGGQPDDSGRSINPAVGDSRLPAVPVLPGEDWGLLREQRAEDVSQGRRDAIDPEFSDAIRAYFRALGQRPN
jgi:hypothetical protein